MLLILCCFLVALSAEDTGADCPPIVSKKEWDAVTGKRQPYLISPLDLVIIQHTATQSCSNDQSCLEIVRDIQKTQIEFLWDIGTSFLVGGTGKVYEGRGWNHVGIHSTGYNNQSIGIAFIGNFNNQEPSPKALNAAQALIQCGVDLNRLTADHKVVVQSQLLYTESPGKKLSSKVMSWADWTSDVTEIKKRADKQESQNGVKESITNRYDSRAATDLIGTSPKHIDLLYNLRDVIAELIQNMSQLAHQTVDTITVLENGMNKVTSLFVEKLVSELKKLRDQVGSAFSTISGIPGVQKCGNSLREQANSLYDTTEIKAKNCADKRVKEIADMIENLGTLSSNAIDYTNTAVENTKNCTELNYGIEASTKACLNSVAQQTENASNLYKSQRNTTLDSINTLLGALPSALDLCAKQHLLEAGIKTGTIVTDISKCPTKNIIPSFNGFGF